jgi:hypothetical protein
MPIASSAAVQGQESAPSTDSSGILHRLFVYVEGCLTRFCY